MQQNISQNLLHKIVMQKLVLSMNSYEAQQSLLFWIVLHCPLWPVWLYHTFPHLINAKKKFVEH
jgi:hypothetical protein